VSADSAWLAVWLAPCHFWFWFGFGDILVPVQTTEHLVTFGVNFVSFGPAPHIYQRGERVGGPVCTIHGLSGVYLVAWDIDGGSRLGMYDGGGQGGGFRAEPPPIARAAEKWRVLETSRAIFIRNCGTHLPGPTFGYSCMPCLQ